MAVDLSALVAPWRAAVVTSEIQNGVVGEPSALPALAEEARRGTLGAIAHLVEGARVAGAEVIHCTFERRADGKGSNANAGLFLGMERSPVRLLSGSHEAQVVDEVGVAPTDLVLPRFHGLSPMAGTSLDPVLRNLGVTTVIVAGVSVNVAITNLVMDAVNRGYEVVLPRDAVCGVPASYAESVIDHTLSLLATVTTVDELVHIWKS